MKEKLTKLSGKMNLRTYTMIVALVIICIVFQIITNGIFLSARNISNLVRSMSITGVIATGAVLLIIAGGIDLSVGSIVALAGGAAALLQVRLGLGSVTVILIAIVLGTLLGMWQGFWVAYKDIPAFIATLGGMLAFRGIYIALTDGITITPMQENFQVIASGYLPPAMGYALVAIIFLGLLFSEINRRKMQAKLSLETSGNVMGIIRIVVITALVAAIIVVLNSYNGTPIPVIILMIFMVVFHFISTKTKFGRDVYAIGGNVEAARLSGINVKRTMLYLYMIVGALSAVSGILLTSRLNGATSSAGNQYEMDVISACVIGGTSMSGGKGSVFGMLVGLLVISSLDNGMLDTLLPNEDDAAAAKIKQTLERSGVKFILGAKVSAIEDAGAMKRVRYTANGKDGSCEGAYVLVGAGRAPVNDIAKSLGLALDEKGFVRVDEQMRTSLEDVYAAGDVAGGTLLAHTAYEEAETAAENCLGGSKTANISLVPRCIFTLPTYAVVGLLEKEAAKDHEIKVGLFPFSASGKAMANGDDTGFVKIVSDAKTGQILGCCILGREAAELISIAVTAISSGCTVEQIEKMMFPHPSLSESFKEAVLDTECKSVHLPMKKR